MQTNTEKWRYLMKCNVFCVQCFSEKKIKWKMMKKIWKNIFKKKLLYDKIK